MAVCQGGGCAVWSGMLRDGKIVNLLLREHSGTGEMGFEGAGGEVVWGNGRRMGSHERLKNAGQNGVGAGCVGACILGHSASGCLLQHLGSRTAGRGSCQGEGLFRSLIDDERASWRQCLKKTGGGASLRVHPGADCAKSHCSAQERARTEMVQGEERGAHAEPEYHKQSFGGKRSGRGGWGMDAPIGASWRRMRRVP